MFVIEGETYSGACKIISKLKDMNIDANIMVGGIGVYPDGEDQEKILLDFAKENDLSIEKKNITTTMQSTIDCIRKMRRGPKC